MGTVKKASYAGVTLPLAPAYLEDKWLSVIHDERRFSPFTFWNFDANTTSLSTPSIPDRPPFRLNVLSWPGGAVQPAHFHCLVETKRFNDIKTAIPEFTTSTPSALTLFDGRDGQTVTAQMYLLPEQPLNRFGSDFSSLWLLTFVDRRFYDAWRRSFISQPDSWVSLYSQIASAFGTTITVDPIPAAYGNPSGKWVTSPNVNLLTVLDAVAFQVGQRIVYGLDGSIRAVNWRTARTAAQSYFAAHPRVVSGGLIPEASIARYVPESVNVLFADTSSGTGTSSVPVEVTNTLVSLAIPEYGTATGVPGTSQTLNADIVSDGSNTAETNSYAAQAAIDWYGWRLQDPDIVYAGIEPWLPTGWEDYVEWTLKLVEDNPALPPSDDPPPGHKPLSTTHVFRGPWTDYVSGDFLAGGAPGTTTALVNQVCPVIAGCVTVTTDYQALVSDTKIFVDASGGAVTVTLPPWRDGDFYEIVKVDSSANAVTVQPQTGTVNGGASVSTTTQWGGWVLDTRCTSGAWVAAAIGTGGGGGAVSSVTGGTAIDVSPTTGAVVVSLDAVIPQAETIRVTDSATSTHSDNLTLYHKTSAVPTTSFGLNLYLDLDYRTGGGANAGQTHAALAAADWADAANRYGTLTLYTYNAAVAIRQIAMATIGGAAGLGFFNTAAVVQPTGDVIAALGTLGLVGSPTLLTFNSVITNPSGTTLSAGSWNPVKATSASSVTLPAATVGRIIGIGIASGSTKLLTINRAGSDLIDGATSRIIWGNDTFGYEWCLLACYETGVWTKAAGKSIPMLCVMQLSMNQSYPTMATFLKVTVDTTVADNTSLMADIPNHRINVQRGSNYVCTGQITYDSGGTWSATSGAEVDILNNAGAGGATLGGAKGSVIGGTSVDVAPVAAVPAQLSTGQFVALEGYMGGTTGNFNAGSPGTYLSVLEVPRW